MVGCVYVQDYSKLKLNDLKYELCSMGAKATKNEKYFANAQLVIRQKHVMMLESMVKLHLMHFYSRYFNE